MVIMKGILKALSVVCWMSSFSIYAQQGTTLEFPGGEPTDLKKTCEIKCQRVGSLKKEDADHLKYIALMNTIYSMRHCPTWRYNSENSKSKYYFKLDKGSFSGAAIETNARLNAVEYKTDEYSTSQCISESDNTGKTSELIEFADLPLNQLPEELSESGISLRASSSAGNVFADWPEVSESLLENLNYCTLTLEKTWTQYETRLEGDRYVTIQVEKSEKKFLKGEMDKAGSYSYQDIEVTGSNITRRKGRQDRNPQVTDRAYIRVYKDYIPPTSRDSNIARYAVEAALKNYQKSQNGQPPVCD